MKVSIPQSTSDITVEQYAKYNMIADDNDKEFVGHKMLSIFLNISMQDALNMEQSVAEETIRDLYDMLDTQHETFSFTHKGTEYAFIPDLEQITLGEYVDIEDYIQNAKDWHKAMAVMFRPVKQRVKDLYDIEPYIGDKRSQETAKDFPASAFITCTVFFYNLSKQLSLNSAFYLGKLIDSKEMKSLRTLAYKDSSQKDGDGLTLSTRLVTEMRRSLNKLLK
jgi:hypothetical protein